MTAGGFPPLPVFPPIPRPAFLYQKIFTETDLEETKKKAEEIFSRAFENWAAQIRGRIFFGDVENNHREKISGGEKMREWKISIMQDDEGRVFWRVVDERMAGGAEMGSGRVPYWDGIDGELLGACVVGFAESLSVDKDGNSPNGN